LLKAILADPGTVVTRGRTLDNAPNLAKPFLETIMRRYQGTRLGRQELDAEVLDDVVGALWKMSDIESTRYRAEDLPTLRRIVVAVDPAVTSGEDSDETGIVVIGLGADGRGYVLEDRSGKHSPDEWARQAAVAFYKWKADRVIGEVNQGGDLVEKTLRTVDANLPYKAVHASRGKVEPNPWRHCTSNVACPMSGFSANWKSNCARSRRTRRAKAVHRIGPTLWCMGYRN
jgi:phage terminase large subunit-like protein